MRRRLIVLALVLVLLPLAALAETGTIPEGNHDLSWQTAWTVLVDWISAALEDEEDEEPTMALAEDDTTEPVPPDGELRPWADPDG